LMKRIVYINDRALCLDSFCDNKISNTKYTIFTFIPKNLWEQFGRFMNKYFLLIACLQLWPLITPVNPASTWGPLLFIFAVSASKEAWDDYNRYLLDKQANEKKVWIVQNGLKIQIHAEDINVGDIVWLRENEEVPCDLVLLGTSEPQGICYVETAALDGETDLKTRVVPFPCLGLTSELLHKVKGLVECPGPDNDIRRFDGNIRLFPPFIENDVFPLTIENTLLQCCYLRNTEWACGVAIYTGNETKLGMSKGLAEPKLTAVDGMIDKLTTAIFLFQLVVVLILGVSGNMWKKFEAHNKKWYVSYPEKAPWFEDLVIPLRFELLCSIMIPISIKVSLDLVKGLYAKFIDWDLQMYDEETDTPAVATNTAISEDLGQIEFILTDKTGTLTENVMAFKACCIKGVTYEHVKDPELLRSVAEMNPEVIKFLLVMGLCNTVVPLKSNTGIILYKAQSQDEEALVSAAAQLQAVLLSRTSRSLCFSLLGRLMEYEILDTLEFTSDRKRMSVVLKDVNSGKLMLLTKGADEVVLSLLRNGQQVKRIAEAVDHFSQAGLRTMFLAWRDLEEFDYHNWSKKFRDASSSVKDREWKMAEVCEQLERNLELLGATAIEDKLQDGVPEAIATLRKAGINFWMLTGDKLSTAVQIGLSCNLVLPEPEGQVLYVQGRTEEDVASSLERVLRTMRITNTEIKDVAFVIDGWALEFALSYHYESFLELAMLAKTAICCRLTPAQKAQLVALLKNCDYRTLAIGDGGNDVKMIQAAHVGVGISGREGLQAVRAADFSFGRFRYLKRLILVHGRYSYNRTAFLAQYSIYKSLLLCFIQILFSFISGVSGSSLFDSLSLMAYNVVYTSIPVMVNALDKDVSEKTVLQHPEILYYCQAGRLINPSTFAGWFGRSLFHAAVVFVITIHVYNNEQSGQVVVSMVAFSGCICLQAFVVALETNSFTVFQHIAIWGNLLAFFILNVAISFSPKSGRHMIMLQLCTERKFWITMLLIVLVGMGPVLALKYFRFTYRPSAINILQKLERTQLAACAAYPSNDECALSNGKEGIPLSVTKLEENPIHEPLLSNPREASLKDTIKGSYWTGQSANHYRTKHM
ncbi:hypothetical protein GOP47_0029057, partial [Adiantum capillus-veneris]